MHPQGQVGFAPKSPAMALLLRVGPTRSQPSLLTPHCLQPGRVVGVDVEWRPSFGVGGRPRPSLMQLAVEGHVFLLDLPVFLEPAGGLVTLAFSRLVSQLLLDPSITKLGEQSPHPAPGGGC